MSRYYIVLYARHYAMGDPIMLLLLGRQAPKAWPCGFYGRSIKNRRRPPVGKALANRYWQRGNGSARSRISKRFGCQTVGLRWD